MEELIQLKGYRGGLRVIIDKEAPLAEVETALVKKLEGLGDFIVGSAITLDAGERALSDDDIRRLQNVLLREFDVRIQQIISSSSKTRRLAGVLDIPAVEEAEPSRDEIAEVLKEFPRANARLVKRTLRAGQEERFLEGSVILMGDVNPGADVIASGDIVVLGSLRGRAFAGALGDRSAVIVALNFDPVQIRIADCISIRPDEGGRRRRFRLAMEIARIEDDRIVVSRYKD
jgi:septum site-determining protein MinC